MNGSDKERIAFRNEITEEYDLGDSLAYHLMMDIDDYVNKRISQTLKELKEEAFDDLLSVPVGKAVSVEAIDKKIKELEG